MFLNKKKATQVLSEAGTSINQLANDTGIAPPRLVSLMRGIEPVTRQEAVAIMKRLDWWGFSQMVEEECIRRFAEYVRDWIAQFTELKHGEVKPND